MWNINCIDLPVFQQIGLNISVDNKFTLQPKIIHHKTTKGLIDKTLAQKILEQAKQMKELENVLKGLKKGKSK